MRHVNLSFKSIVNFLKEKIINKKFIIKCLVVLLVYELFFQPTVSKMLFGWKEYSGIDLYNSQKYTKFEKGQLLQEHLKKLSVDDQWIITDFSYFDSMMQDNIFYGKYVDYYAIDFSYCPIYQELYQQCKNNAIADLKRGQAEVYLTSIVKTESTYDHLYICFSGNNEHIYLIFRTYASSKNDSSIPDRVWWYLPEDIYE